jgi:hypothetical protein
MADRMMFTFLSREIAPPGPNFSVPVQFSTECVHFVQVLCIWPVGLALIVGWLVI